MSEITALVHTKNSAATLRDCLDSLRFAARIFVIDMMSSDESVSIAKRYPNVTVLTHQDVGYVEPARAFALSHVATPWTLILDADESLPESLQKELLRQAKKDDPDCVAFAIPRKNILFEKWIEHTGWWPDYQLRFFRTGHVVWPTEIHAQPHVHGSIIELPADEDLAIVHQNYQTIEQFVERMNRYTSIEASLTEKSGNTHPHPAQAFADELARRLIAHQGYLDGTHGMFLSFLQSFYPLLTHAKKWQRAGFPVSIHADDEYIAHLEQALSHLRYWTASYRVNQSTGLQKIWWKFRRKLGI